MVSSIWKMTVHHVSEGVGILHSFICVVSIVVTTITRVGSERIKVKNTSDRRVTWRIRS